MKRFGLILIASSSILFGTTLNVPADYTTIQSGLVAASVGDTILVQPGTYTENIFWPETNGIKLISAGDSSNTIIDGGGVSSVIYINPQTTTINTNTLIQGFKITGGGNVTNGGGLMLIGASPIIRSVSVSNNTVNSKGGGIYLYQASPTITDATISGNTSLASGSFSGGGGMYLDDSSPMITDVIISNNSANNNGEGGGLYLGSSSPTITDVTILNNSASGSGGGMHMHISSPTITGVTIYGDSAGYVGGGLDLSHSYPIILGSNIIGNSAGYGGGGIHLYQSSPTITDVTISHNSATGTYNTGNGGGLYFSYSSPTITGVVISENSANESGGGMYLEYSSSPNIINTMLNRNSDGIYIVSGTPTINGSAFINNGTGLLNTNNVSLIEADDNYWGHASGPYHPASNTMGLGDSVNVFVNVSPWLIAPLDLLAGSPIIITGISAFLDSNFTLPTGDNIDPGDTLYLELAGTDSDSLTTGLSVIAVTNMMTSDTILVTLKESSVNSGIFRGLIYTGESTNQIDSLIMGTDGQVLKLISRISPGQNITLIIGDTPLPIISGFTLSDATDLQHVLNHIPLFSWSYTDPLGSAQSSYQVQVSSDEAFTNIDLWDSGVISGSDTSTVYGGNVLTDGTTYYARLQVITATGIPSNYSEFSFRMNSQPEILQPLSPVDGIIISDNSPLLEVENGSDAESDWLTYDFQVSIDEQFTSLIDSAYGVAEGTISTSWTVSSALSDNVIWWRACANDGYENGAFFEPASFTLDAENDPPGQFSLLAPNYRSIQTILNPNFVWTESTDPDNNDSVHYEIFAWTDSTSNSVIVTGVTNFRFDLPDGLIDNARYDWTVKAIDIEGLVTFADTSFFYTDSFPEPPLPFTVNRPIDGASELDSVVVFEWNHAIETDPVDSLDYTLVYATNWADSSTYQYVNGITDTSYTLTLDNNKEYHWLVEARDTDGFVVYSDNKTAQRIVVGVLSIDEELFPVEFALYQNYPNPFNPTTQLTYDLPEQSFVNLAVYDLLGRQVTTLVNGMEEPGFRSVTWNATDSNGHEVSAGMYIYVIRAGSFTQTRKMVLLK